MSDKRIFLALGSNLGNRLEHLKSALKYLETHGVRIEAGDIPLPEHQTGVGGRRRERISVCDPPFPDHLPQIFVLDVQKLRGGWVGRADVKQIFTKVGIKYDMKKRIFCLFLSVLDFQCEKPG